MPTMTITITNVPGFAMVGVGYQFTGTMNLPTVVDGAIRINSMRLYYGYGRTYTVAPYLTAVCGDTTFRTDYFTISETGQSSLKERTLNVLTWNVGTDHLLRKNGRTITFTAQKENSSTSKLIDRARGGDMTLTVDYTILQSSLTLDKTTVDAGETMTATLQAGDAAYAHKLTFAAGSRTEIMELNAGVGSAGFTIPMEWLEEIPRATQLAATCRLDTYSGATLMGSETKSFTITCPASVVPACEVTAQPVNGFEGLYLGGRSSAELAIVNESAPYGATVVGYHLAGAGFSKSLKSAVCGPLVQGEHTFTATVTDSRGRTGKAAVTVTVIPYTAPTLAGIEVYRSDGQGTADDEGAYIALKATAAFAPLEGKNSLTLQGRYRAVAGAWSDWTAMAQGEMTLLGGALLSTASYEAQIQAVDGVGNAANYTQRIPTAQVAFHLKEGGQGAAFGMYQEKDKRLSIPGDWKYYRGDEDMEATLKELIQTAQETAERALAGGSNPLDAYPVGALYWSSDPTSPASLFGGTWTQIKDRFVLAAGSSYSNGAAGGNPWHAHSYGFDALEYYYENVLTLPGVSGLHTYDSANKLTIAGNWSHGSGYYQINKSSESGASQKTIEVKRTTATTSYVNTLPPYIVKYCWERTA